MLKDRTVRDLFILTLVKLAAITAIYYACFAAYEDRPVDTATHLLGPAAGPAPPGAQLSPPLNPPLIQGS